MDAFNSRLLIGQLDSNNGTANPKLASTLYAFEVPLNPTCPYQTSAGDGINGIRVVWYFAPRKTMGRSFSQICKLWHDQNWLAANPDDALSICKKTFEYFDEMKSSINNGRSRISIYPASSVKTADTRKAAVLRALGHNYFGYSRQDDVVTWVLGQSAAADAALYDDKDLYRKLPNASISYAKGAILGHRQMIKAMKEIQFARVQHKGRTAIIGKDIPPKELEIIEKLLYRK
jgi:hypothetical protein